MAKSLHEKLEISFAELGALLGTQQLLKHMKYQRRTGGPFAFSPYEPARGVHAFNMNIACTAKDCGSVSCIGGTMGQIMGLNAGQSHDYTDGTSVDNSAIRRSHVLRPLFYPTDDNAVKDTIESRGCWLTLDYDSITPKQALRAIGNFLKYGKPKWAKILTRKNYK